MDESKLFHSEINYALFHAIKTDYKVNYESCDAVCYFVELNGKRIKVEITFVGYV